MATKEVLFSVCDRCDAKTETDTQHVVGKRGPKPKVLLPAGWTHAFVKSAFVPEVLAVDLCTECSKKMLVWLQPTESGK